MPAVPEEIFGLCLAPVDAVEVGIGLEVVVEVAVKRAKFLRAMRTTWRTLC